VKLFANYSIPLVWGILGLVAGCVVAYFGFVFVWTRAIIPHQAPTPEDGLMVMILSLIAGVFIGSASLYASAQTRWTHAKHYN